MMKNFHGSKRAQMGVTIAESLVTLGIFSLILVGTAHLSKNQETDERISGASEHFRMVSDAVRLNVKHNRAAIMAQASPGVAALIPVSQLIADNYLPSGFNANNLYNHRLCALVIEPSPGVLNTLVVAEGGLALDDVSLSHFSAQIGSGGGGLFSTNSTTLIGAGGGWKTPLSSYHNIPNHLGARCDGTSGRVQIAQGSPVLAQWMDPVDEADPGYLNRTNDPINPDVNAMGTNIDMGGHRIGGLKTVTIGSPCGSDVASGELASGPRGEVTSCVSGTWTAAGLPYWGAPSTTFGSLPACNASNVGETRVVSDINSIFTCTGIRWDVSVNASGDLSLPAHLRVEGSAHVGQNLDVSGLSSFNGSTIFRGNVNTFSQLNANAGMEIGANYPIKGLGELNIDAGNNLYLRPNVAGGQVVIGGSGGNGNLTAKGYIQSEGSVISNESLSVGEFIRIDKVVNVGDYCSPNGLMGRSTSGSVLACESGVWRTHGFRPVYSKKYSGLVTGDGWTYMGYSPSAEYHWCKSFNVPMTGGGFVVFSFYNRLSCSTVHNDCFTGVVIRDTVNPQLSVTTRHVKNPASGETSETTTFYNEFTSGTKTYQLCALTSWLSGSRPPTPFVSYSITAFKK